MTAKLPHRPRLRREQILLARTWCLRTPANSLTNSLKAGRPVVFCAFICQQLTTIERGTARRGVADGACWRATGQTSAREGREAL